jgi:hypothetical protein
LADSEDDRWRVKLDWSEPKQTITMRMDHAFRGVVVIDGKGSIAGSHALIGLVEGARDEIGHEVIIESLVDLRKLHGAPLRSQLIIGKWLFKRKDQIRKIAVFGGSRVEMKLASTIMTIARMKNAHFTKHLSNALTWLEWPADFHK